MTEDDKQKIREMKLRSPGWKILETWMDEHIKSGVNILINSNDEEVRGKIKGMRFILNKVNQFSKKK